MSISSFESRPDSVAQTAIEYAAVTERVALGVARLEGSGAPEKAYTLATEIFREELDKVSAAGEVAILREERLDESGQLRRLKTRPELLSVGDRLGVVQGWWKDTLRSYVYGTAYDKIHRYHPRARTGRRHPGIPTLARNQRKKY
ncbi:hypothetical protein BH24ACT22_BH24ACT22_04580 [soil metagenome]